MTLLFRSFLRRDFLSAISYKFGFLYEIGSLLSGILTLYFISSMIGDTKIEALDKYKTSYFSFSLLGVAFLDFMWISLRSFSQQMRIAQLMGTLEAMLMTPASPFLIILCSASYTYIKALFRGALYIVLGTSIFGLDIGEANIFSAFVFLILIVAAFIGFGILSAGLTLYMKSAEPITSLIGGISFLFGGIVFPVESMPVALQKISWFLPMTHGVEGIRFSLLHGKSVYDLYEHAFVLTAWAVVMLPLSFAALDRIIRYLRRSGSFGSY